MSSYVLDSSAVLALMKGEPGSERVRAALTQGAEISAVNLSEVVAKLSEAGRPEEEVRELLEPLEMNAVEFDLELAYQAGFLRPPTRAAGLSCGDRACLALAQRLKLPALTADRAWEGLSLDVAVQVIR